MISSHLKYTNLIGPWHSREYIKDTIPRATKVMDLTKAMEFMSSTGGPLIPECLDQVLKVLAQIFPTYQADIQAMGTAPFITEQILLLARAVTEHPELSPIWIFGAPARGGLTGPLLRGVSRALGLLTRLLARLHRCSRIPVRPTRARRSCNLVAMQRPHSC